VRFGISTHLFHDQRLGREHLVKVASHGFEAIELFATRSHFDYHDGAAIAALRDWLKELGLRLHGIHAPIMDRFGVEGAIGYSTAAGDHAARQAAVREAAAAIEVARQIPAEVLVLHLGTPAAKSPSSDNVRAAAVRSAEEICTLAEPAGLRVALEVIPNELSSASALVDILERDFEGTRVGICLDFGHAHIMGDVADAIETTAEHLITTHVHDNRGRSDDHLVPYQGTIDWPRALMSMQKIGYDGTYLMELAGAGDPGAVLEEARRARQRIERALAE
jgi:sugar phosphate isomerase/epimerase